MTAVGIAKQVYFEDSFLTKLLVEIDSKEYHCINYKPLTGKVNAGDKLLLNTTAVELQLGTGGFHFVMANLSCPVTDSFKDGHIMKLKYTPMQISCMAAESQESRYHEIFDRFTSLDGMPVLVGSLHSMLAPCSIYLKAKKPDLKICYIMTDGGALPLYLSDIVRKLKQRDLLEATVTYGNAFGGDYECVNVYTALITAKEIIKADIAVICMGPGIVGTDTRYGYSGVEQGSIADAANKLGGFTVVMPRISFADSRQRHYGVSHHSLTVLKQLCCTKVNIALPLLDDQEKLKIISRQLEEITSTSKHNIYYVDSCDIKHILLSNAEDLSKMGRSFDQDPEYFITCATSAKLCLNRLTSAETT